MKSATIAALGLALLAAPLTRGADDPPKPAPAPAPEAGELKDTREKASYAIGLSIGKDMKRQGADLDPELVARGIRDAMGGGKTLLTEAQVAEAMQAFRTQMVAKQQETAKGLGAKNKADGEAFLAANAKKAGVKVLPSGLQYKVLKSGTGKTPKADDTVSVHYEGTLIDGTVFDSSLKRGEPASFQVNQVIRGWTEALQKMKVGDKWQLVIPAGLAYQERGTPGGPIGPNATLLFDVELLGVE